MEVIEKTKYIKKIANNIDEKSRNRIIDQINPFHSIKDNTVIKARYKTNDLVKLKKKVLLCMELIRI